MCGLIGALLTEPSLTAERIAGALATIAHRGPDHTGWWCSPDRRTVLGHVRLSIIGLDNGSQPLASADGEVRCVVNGELYGYRAIRSALKAEGRHFASDSDSEIALHLYEKLGGDFVHQLRGEFAVVIADQRRRSLIAVRDRFGIKPLFYTVQGGDVLVASEIKALLALGAPARWDAAAFFAECHNVRTADRTLFAGIRAVPPGCALVARDGQVEIRPYWDTDYPSREVLAADGRSEADIVSGFREVLDNAVADRLVADVEVASYLSGGIDSSAVLGLAQGKANRPIRAFTIVFGEKLYNEERLAQQTAELLGATFVPVPISQRDLAEAFPDALWHAETLVFNGHGVAKYLLSRTVRDAGIKVVFTGEGADEILGGYAPFRRDVLLHNTEQQPQDDIEKLLAELDATNTRTVLPTFILTVLGDRMEMAHSVEGRVPFLDHHVAEYAAQVPVHHKIRGLREKHVLREAVRHCVLPEVYDRQKHPFMSPPARDIDDALAVFCQDTLRSRSVEDQPFFNPCRIRGLMDQVAAMEPADRAAFEGVVLRIVSTCILQQRFGLAS
ncbi:MAG: asparagine synthase (glutamine-hydrolyzing) [Pseudonocardiaceae bacterium]|jgi:asparagine synthase (glutamine-hydrolysing)|nr:asparagine synthase (glutamine-hydrolyzing) [Pseudonocardiaceae bacterium]